MIAVIPLVMASAGAISPVGGKSLLLVIRRTHTYLNSVDAVNAKGAPTQQPVTYQGTLIANAGKDIVNVVCDFLEVWIHQILYFRDLYPKEIFELRKKYNVPVHMATHAGVTKYVSQFVQSVHPLLLKGTCKSIALVVEFQGQPLERFVFETDSVVYRALESNDISVERLLTSESTITLADLQQHLRACLLRIEACVASLSSISPESTFTLTLETQHEPLDHDEQQPQQWIPASSAVAEGQGQRGRIRWEGMIPIKTIPMDIYRINTFILEAVKKGKHVSK